MIENEHPPNRLGWFCWDMLLKLQRLIMLSALILTTACVLAEVVSRYLIGSSIVGVEELGAYIAFWIYFVGAAYGTYSRSHISAELTHLFLQKQSQMAASKFISNLISFGLAAYIIPWGWRYVEWGYTHNEQSSATFLGHTYAITYFQISIFVGIVLMALYFLVETIGWFRVVFLKQTHLYDSLIVERPEVRTWI